MDRERVDHSEDVAARPPPLSAFLAYAPMLLLLALALAGWIWPWALHAGLVLAAALLCFFAGVHRGLSFRQKGGATARQLLTMLLLFALGLGALWFPALPAALLLVAGYAALLVLDPQAAAHAEAPAYFAPLRRRQILLPLAATLLMLGRIALIG